MHPDFLVLGVGRRPQVSGCRLGLGLGPGLGQAYLDPGLGLENGPGKPVQV